MTQAKMGDTVKLHYTVKFEDGMVFDTSLDNDPLQFTIGDREVIPGFEEAVIGMSPSESKTIKVPVDKAYGPHREDLVVEIDRKQLPADLKPEVGLPLQGHRPDGESIEATVIAVSESSVTLDANHPLAGKDLIFDIQFIKIV